MGLIKYCLLRAIRKASPLLSSGMPSHFTESSRYLYSSECSSHTARARANPRATCTTPRAASRATSRPSRAAPASARLPSTYTTRWVGSMRTKTKSVVVRLRLTMAVLLCLASSVFSPRPKYLAPSHRLRGSFLHTLVIAWSHLRVTSASALLCHRRLPAPENSSLAPGAELPNTQAPWSKLTTCKCIYLFLGLSLGHLIIGH